MHHFLGFVLSLDPGFAIFVPLPFGIFILKRDIIFEFKDNNLKGFLLRIVFDLKESFHGLEPLMAGLKLPLNLGVKFHIPLGI